MPTLYELRELLSKTSIHGMLKGRDFYYTELTFPPKVYVKKK